MGNGRWAMGGKRKGSKLKAFSDPKSADNHCFQLSALSLELALVGLEAESNFLSG
jgi:hypothetical protein